MPTTSAAHGGRPLDEDLSAAILDAALRVLATDGYRGFSIAAVASEAGAHRPAIYRRWPNKVDLAIAAIERLKPSPEVGDTGHARDDLVAFLVDTGCNIRNHDAELALRLSNELTSEPELAEAVEERIVLPRRTMLREIIERGVGRGQLRATLDAAMAVDVLMGMLQFRKRRGPALRPAEVEQMVDLVMGGLRELSAP